MLREQAARFCRPQRAPRARRVRASRLRAPRRPSAVGMRRTLLRRAPNVDRSADRSRRASDPRSKSEGPTAAIDGAARCSIVAGTFGPKRSRASRRSRLPTRERTVLHQTSRRSSRRFDGWLPSRVGTSPNRRAQQSPRPKPRGARGRGPRVATWPERVRAGKSSRRTSANPRRARSVDAQRRRARRSERRARVLRERRGAGRSPSIVMRTRETWFSSWSGA